MNLVTGTCFSLLMPASALPLLGPALCIVCWLAVVVVCVFVPGAVIPATLGFALVTLLSNGGHFTQVEGWECASLSLSWGNLISLSGLVADVAFVAQPGLLDPSSWLWLTPAAACLSAVWTVAISV